ncbi:MAG: lipoprotein [Xanthomonadales bacterium]|nr:lipoprotein [Xanthomonadales bacterium]
MRIAPRPVAFVGLLLLTAMLMSACGNRGPLYLPEPETSASAAASEPFGAF